jgi:uncharacterized surface protein with fasciclin (FAS1) repeats
MKRLILNAVFAVGFLVVTENIKAQNGDIVEAASKSKDLGTLSVGVIAADLSENLKGSGPFTVFAPDNAAFEKLPAGALENLLLPESKSKLAEIINFHIVKGSFDSESLSKKIKEGNGKSELNTVNGKKVVIFLENDQIKLLDENGNIATIIKSDLKAENGIIHTIDSVIIP